MQLYINTPGTMVKQKDACFQIIKEEIKTEISPLKVESIVFSNQAFISTQALVLAMEHNIDVIFLDKYGEPTGRVWHSKLGSTTLIRRKQLEAAENELGLSLVKEMIKAKMDNQIRFLKKLMASRPGNEDGFKPYIARIESARSSINDLEGSLEEKRGSLMGFEGVAGRAYFECLSPLLPEKYRFDGRSRRPAKDEFNAVLNYMYGVLYSLVEKSLILAGLDPFVGFLHTDNYNKKSLVFDFIEPFRIYAEQCAVYLFTGKKIKDEYFDKAEGAVSLNQDGKPVVIESINNALEESVRFRRKNVKRRHILLHKAHRMANLLLEDTELGQNRTEWLEIKEL
jgi:CRISPR-associated protein Cas1